MAETRGAVDKAVGEFFGPESLAEYLHVPVATVYRWNYTGAGPRIIRVGRHVRYRRSDVERWLEDQTAARP